MFWISYFVVFVKPIQHNSYLDWSSRSEKSFMSQDS